MRVVSALMGSFRPRAGGYIDCSATVRDAARAGMGVGDYVEQLWNQKGCTAQVVERMLAAWENREPLQRVVEIGPGTGRYLEAVRTAFPSSIHEIYETADDWAEYLGKMPGVERRRPDGESLKHTASDSADLCHAHGVYVYTPFLVTVSYIREMARAVRSNGLVVFDVYTEESFTPPDLAAWLASEHRYPCYIGGEMVMRVTEPLNLTLADRFSNKHGLSRSEYFVFRKQASD